MKKALLMAVGITWTALYADVVFQEDFTNATGSDNPLSSIGWHSNLGSTGEASDESNTSYQYSPVVSVADYLFYNIQYDVTDYSDPILTWTDVSLGEIGSITNIHFTISNNQAEENLQMAIKVSGKWYVSQTAFNSQDVMVSFDLAVQSAAWNSLSFESGTTLAEGGSVSLPLTGDVEAVGIFDSEITRRYGPLAPTGNARVRVDDYVVEAIPEPTTMGLFAVFSIVGLGVRRIANS